MGMRGRAVAVTAATTVSLDQMLTTKDKLIRRVVLRQQHRLRSLEKTELSKRSHCRRRLSTKAYPSSDSQQSQQQLEQECFECDVKTQVEGSDREAGATFKIAVGASAAAQLRDEHSARRGRDAGVVEQ